MMVTSLNSEKQNLGKLSRDCSYLRSRFSKKNDHYIKPGIKVDKSFYAPNFTHFLHYTVNTWIVDTRS